MPPNLIEDQALTKYFKYFDLANTGVASLRDWMKAMEKVGVVLSKAYDMEEVFKYYDLDKQGVIDYKRFSADLFSGKRVSRPEWKEVKSVIKQTETKKEDNK